MFHLGDWRHPRNRARPPRRPRPADPPGLIPVDRRRGRVPGAALPGGFGGRLGLVPLYGTFRLAFPLPRCAVYLAGRLGWAGFHGDEDLTGTFGRLTGGLFYCAGLGAELRLRRLGRSGGALFLEAAYSAASGALTDEWFGDLRTDLRVHGLELAAGLAKGF